MKERILIESADGSHTLYIPQIDEHYHSVNGAIQESMHVFIREGLDKNENSSPRVLEFGFGTGLNALLTLQSARKTGKAIYYQTIEKYPLDLSLAVRLNYCEQTEQRDETVFHAMHISEYDEDVRITPTFVLRKIKGDFLEAEWEGGIDLVYFDAFAPNKQPENWDESLFKRIYDSMNENGILVTYCAKGVVRRQLQQVGFVVERIPGPPGKREMLRAIKRSGC